MNTVSIALTVLIGLIVILALLFWWLFKHFASMTPKERKLYEQELDQELDDVLTKQALNERDLRDKVNDITKT